MQKIRPEGDVSNCLAHLFSEKMGIIFTLRNRFLRSYNNKIDTKLTRTQSLDCSL